MKTEISKEGPFTSPGKVLSLLNVHDLLLDQMPSKGTTIEQIQDALLDFNTNEIEFSSPIRESENIDPELRKRSWKALNNDKLRHSDFKEGLMGTLASGKSFNRKKSVLKNEEDWRKQSSNKRVERMRQQGIYDTGEFMSDAKLKFSSIEIEKKQLHDNKCESAGLPTQKRLKICEEFREDLATVLSKSVKKKSRIELEVEEAKKINRATQNMPELQGEDKIVRVDESYTPKPDNRIALSLEDKFENVFKHNSQAACNHCERPLFIPGKQYKTKSLKCKHRFHWVIILLT